MKNFSRLIFLLIPFLVIITEAESDPEPLIIEGIIEELQDDEENFQRTGRQLQQSQARSSAKQQNPEELISGKKWRLLASFG